MIVCRNALFRGIALFACSASAFALPFSAKAQVRQKILTKRSNPAAAAQLSELGDTVAILPWSYKNGKDVAVQSAREVCNQLLSETGFNVFLIKSPTGAMPPAMPGNNASKKAEPPFAFLLDRGRAILGLEASSKADVPFVLPTPEQMTEIGEKLGTRYVLAGRAQWHARDVWVGISNRMKSICTVDLLILDTNSKRLVLDAHNVMGDSTEKKNPFNTITSAISLNPLPLVIPGSITPEEQRAVAVAIGKAMEPWLKTERIRAALAQADESSETDTSDSRPAAGFSTLVSEVRDIQANLHVTEQDAKPVEAMDKDLARLFSLQDVKFEYKEPNKLRLSATSSRDGQEALIIDEANRDFVIPDRKIVHQQDLSEAPNRRLSPLDFCGLLTRGMFDYMRARFVKQEPRNGVNTVVYDLTYWGVDDGPYHRVWIDPATHMIVRSELYDRGSQLKAIFLYEQPTEIAPRVWLPARVEVENAEHKIFTSIQVADARVDQGISDSLFTVTGAQHSDAAQKRRHPEQSSR